MPLPPMAQQDADQVLRYAFDASTGRIKVDAIATLGPGGISAADGDNIAISDGTDTMAVNPDGSTNVRITDGTDTLAVNADGSINTNIGGAVSIEIDAADGDNIAIADATTGDKMTVRPDGNATVVNSNSIVPEPFDYIDATYPSATQEVYVYKLGGSGGTTVATITVNYVDATKTSLLNLART